MFIKRLLEKRFVYFLNVTRYRWLNKNIVSLWNEAVAKSLQRRVTCDSIGVTCNKRCFPILRTVPCFWKRYESPYLLLIFGIMVAGISNDATRQREQLVPPGEEGRHESADLRRSLVHGDLVQRERLLRLSLAVESAVNRRVLPDLVHFARVTVGHRHYHL